VEQERRNQKHRTGSGTANGKKRPPVRYDENGRPIVPKKRPVRYDENGRPIVPKKRPVRYDENGRPIRPKQPQSRQPQPKRYEKYEQADAPAFDRHAYAQKKAKDAEKRREQKKNKWSARIGACVIVFQALISIIFFVLLNLLDMLPMRYIVVIGIILLVLWGFTFVSQKARAGQKVGRVYAILLTLVLCLGSVYIWKAYDVMGNLTAGQVTKLSDVSVIVMQDSAAQSLEDLRGKRFGIQKTIDRENTDLTLSTLQERFNEKVTTTEYESLKSQIQALYSGKIDAIIINEVYRSLIREDFEKFDTETRVVDAFTYKKEAKENSKADIKVDTEPFNVYLSGNDEWGAVSLDNGRTDVNIIATVNPATKQILLTTTPRDYYIELPFYDGCKDKLTHAGLYGIDTSMETLENLYDIKIDYYVRINFSGFQNIVDALGGVNVYSEYAFEASDGSVSFDKGYNYLGGYDALLFVRERYAFSNGDVQRGRNQMAMIKALTQKIFSPSILTNYMSLMNSLSSCFITDMPSNKIGDLVKMQLNDGAEWNIVSNSVLGYANMRPTYSGGSERLSVLDPDEEDLEAARELIRKCMNGETIRAPYKDYSLKVNDHYDPDSYTGGNTGTSSYASSSNIDLDSSFINQDSSLSDSDVSEDLSSDPEYSDSSEWTESSEPGEGEGSYEEPPVESDQSSEETDNTGEVTE
jgi:LCP family protein required for cell wall assembly